METEVADLIGADRHERTPEPSGHRNGYRLRTWDTRVGTIELAIPKVRPGTYFPSLLQPRRRAEHAHGGPTLRDAWGFDHTGQLFANRGYALLRVNFRGSAGYGRPARSATVDAARA